MEHFIYLSKTLRNLNLNTPNKLILLFLLYFFIKVYISQEKGGKKSTFFKQPTICNSKLSESQNRSFSYIEIVRCFFFFLNVNHITNQTYTQKMKSKKTQKNYLIKMPTFFFLLLNLDPVSFLSTENKTECFVLLPLTVFD